MTSGAQTSQKLARMAIRIEKNKSIQNVKNMKSQGIKHMFMYVQKSTSTSFREHEVCVWANFLPASRH